MYMYFLQSHEFDSTKDYLPEKVLTMSYDIKIRNPTFSVRDKDIKEQNRKKRNIRAQFLRIFVLQNWQNIRIQYLNHSGSLLVFILNGME